MFGFAARPPRAPAAPASRAIEALLPSGRLVQAEVRARRGTRRLALKIDPVARALVLAVPPRTSRATLTDMIATHGAWIEARLAALPPAMPFVDGGVILLRGQRVRLAFRRGRGAPVLCGPGADGLPILEVAAASPDRFSARVLAALKTWAHADAVDAAARLMALLSRSPGTVTIRDARSRWGSCTARGDIMLNWRLIGAPPEVLAYVMAHELAHLKELNHSPRFWAEVARLMPDYAGSRDWLRRHGTVLHALGAPD